MTYRRHNLIARLLAATLSALAAGTGGCFQPVMDAVNQIAGRGGEDDALYTTKAALERGLIIILHGIEGKSNANEGIRQGLLSAGLDDAMAVVPWGAGIPLIKTLVNEVNVVGNRNDGQRIADLVVSYQNRYPGRPVVLIGHSAGCGIAVFAAESLSAGRQVDGIILIAPSLSASYDLTGALARSRRGIVNFHNRNDRAALAVGTTVFGTIDRAHGPSAGLHGFDPPAPEDPFSRHDAYRRLHQVDLTQTFNVSLGGTHFAPTSPPFVATHIAPWVHSPHWPPPPPSDR